MCSLRFDSSLARRSLSRLPRAGSWGFREAGLPEPSTVYHTHTPPPLAELVAVRVGVSHGGWRGGWWPGRDRRGSWEHGQGLMVKADE